MKSGIKHVYWAAYTETWFVEISYKGKRYRSVHHETVEEAEAALAELKKKHGIPEHGSRRLMGETWISTPKGRSPSAPRVMVKTDRGIEQLSRYKARLALGKDLPPGAIVHHVDGNALNNDNTNLVICPDSIYHNLLHSRM